MYQWTCSWLVSTPLCSEYHPHHHLLVAVFRGAFSGHHCAQRGTVVQHARSRGRCRLCDCAKLGPMVSSGRASRSMLMWQLGALHDLHGLLSSGVGVMEVAMRWDATSQCSSCSSQSGHQRKTCNGRHVPVSSWRTHTWPGCQTAVSGPCCWPAALTARSYGCALFGTHAGDAGGGCCQVSATHFSCCLAGPPGGGGCRFGHLGVVDVVRW